MTAEPDDQPSWTTVERAAWMVDLKQELVERGYDSNEVEQLIAEAVDRFRSAAVRDFIPLLVSRSVQRTLRER
jgi:hypothetical protein